jgi:hypothetical protein
MADTDMTPARAGAAGAPVARPRSRTRLVEAAESVVPALATVAVAAAAIALGRGTPHLDLALAAGMLAAAIAAPPLGVVALIAGSLASPFAIPTGTHTDLSFPLVAIAVLSALWMGRALWRRDLAVLRLPAVRAAWALAAVAALAGAAGNVPSLALGSTAPPAAQLGAIGEFACAAAALTIAAESLRDPRWLHRVTWTFLGIGAVFVGSRIIPELASTNEWFIEPGAAGSLTWTWFAALAGAEALANRSLNWRLRTLLAMAVATELGAALVFGREWVAGWLPPLVAVLTAVVLAFPLLGGALVGLGGFFAALQLPRVVTAVMVGDNRYSLSTRLDAWGILLGDIVARRPLLGLGPANYFHATPRFPIRGYAVSFSSHNTYVDLLAQTGIVGFGCFAWLAIAVGRAGWRLCTRGSRDFAGAYAIAGLAGLVATLAAGMLGDWVLPFVYNVTLAGMRSSVIGWVFLGGLLALAWPDEMRAAAAAPAWSTRRWLVAITAGAIAVRIAAAIVLGDTVVPVSGAADQVSYDVLAQRIVAGHGFTFPTAWYPFTPADTPTAHWSFLYTLYLAAVYAVCGHHPLIARLLQAVTAGAACWLVFRIARRLFDARVGLVAAALTAGYAYFIFFAAALMTQTFFILALLAAMDRALALAAEPTRGRWLALGACLGIGAVFRQTVLLFVPIVFAWLWWQTRGRARGRDTALALAMIALCVVPWTLRNYAAYGELLLLNSNGGYFFWASNHPDQGDTFDPTLVIPIPFELRGRPEPIIDRALMRQALGFIAGDPRRFLDLAWSRAGTYFWITPSDASSPTSNLARLASFGVLAPFMIAGLWLSRRRWRMCLPLYLYVLVDTVLHLASWAAPRYRLPSDALLIVFAALAIVATSDRLHRRGPEPVSRLAVDRGRSGGTGLDRATADAAQADTL